MNRGTLLGLGGAPAKLWTPRLVAATTDPTLGTPNALFGGSGIEGRYVVVDGVCVGSCTVEWGAGGSGGTGGYLVEAPVPALDPRSRNYAVSDYPVGSLFYSGAGGAGTGVALLTTSGGSANRPAGSWFTLQAGSHTVGGASAFSAATTKTVTHGLATTPQAVMLTPADNRTLWVTSIGATTFVANAAASNSAAFQWLAFLQTNALSSAYPFAWGTVLDHFEFSFAYPVA